MPELQFTRDDVDSLIGKLNLSELSGQERALLLAIFLVAKGQVSSLGEVGAEADLAVTAADLTVAQLKDQLTTCFIPDKAAACAITYPPGWIRPPGPAPGPHPGG